MTITRLLILVVCGWLAVQVVKADIQYVSSESQWLGLLTPGQEPVEYDFLELPQFTVVVLQYVPELAFPAPHPSVAVVQPVGGDDHALQSSGPMRIQTPQGAEGVGWRLRPGWTTQPFVTIAGIEYAPPFTCAVPPGASTSFCGVVSDDPIESIRLVNTLGVDQLIDDLLYVAHPVPAGVVACVSGATPLISIQLAGDPLEVLDVDVPEPGACITHPTAPAAALRYVIEVGE